LNVKNATLQKDGYTTEKRFDFSLRSTVGVGGIAPMAVYPDTEEKLVKLLRNFENEGVSYHVLGNLSNVLPPDGVSKRVVVCTKLLKGISVEKGFYAEAGVVSGALISAMKTYELSGAEFLSGIPCTLGGALYMNAGVAGFYLSDIVESVRVYRRGEVIELSQKDCGYGYKTSVFMQNGDVILGARLCLRSASESEITANLKAFKERRQHLPKGKSMGCVFKNPQGYTAGKLIEVAGLKGLRMGDAYVSLEHANFIINDKNATAKQIKGLIGLIKNAVYAQYKIKLEEEIRYLD
jgi:UDP-N-acetylmuramate dehydrogenase